MLDLPVSHRGEPGEHVAQVGVGIDAAAAATLDNGVEDGAALAGIGIAQEEPVLFPKSVGRMEFSTRLLSIWIRPSSR